MATENNNNTGGRRTRSAGRNTGARRRKTHLVQLGCSIVLTAVGCGLIIGGFLVPPQGEIHSSVLIAFGEILTFVGALFGIDYHYKAREL